MDQFNGSLTDLVGGGERMISPWSRRRDVPGRHPGSEEWKISSLAGRPEHTQIQKYRRLLCTVVLGRAFVEDENVLQFKTHRIRRDDKAGTIGVASIDQQETGSKHCDVRERPNEKKAPGGKEAGKQRNKYSVSLLVSRQQKNWRSHGLLTESGIGLGDKGSNSRRCTPVRLQSIIEGFVIYYYVYPRLRATSNPVNGVHIEISSQSVRVFKKEKKKQNEPKATKTQTKARARANEAAVSCDPIGQPAIPALSTTP
ncbi:hypothetical protein TMatcc_003059 [Talaromyces marneffei ATCC 18224]